MHVLMMICILSLLVCFLAQAYMVWKVRALYQLLGDGTRDISFYDLSVWTWHGPAWAKWRLGPRIHEFNDLPANVLQQVQRARQHARPVKALYYGAGVVGVGSVILNLVLY